MIQLPGRKRYQEVARIGRNAGNQPRRPLDPRLPEGIVTQGAPDYDVVAVLYRLLGEISITTTLTLRDVNSSHTVRPTRP